MTSVFMLRHGPTEWNVVKRIQGRTDIPLLDSTITALKKTRINDNFKSMQWYCSPLLRTRETASALGLDPVIATDLIEMNWGEWEGKTLSSLRETQARRMELEEKKGVYMTPAGGESPLQVGQRLMSWLSNLNPEAPIGAVTHKGVIRAALALACEWDMKGKPPVKIDWSKAVEFSWSKNGKLQLERVNVEL